MSSTNYFQNSMMHFDDDDDEALENLDLIKFGDFLLEDDLVVSDGLGEDFSGVAELQHHVRRMSIDLLQYEIPETPSMDQMKTEQYRRLSFERIKRRDSFFDSAYQGRRKRTFDDCAPITTTSGDKKRPALSSEHSFPSNFNSSVSCCGSGSNLSTILSLMSQEQLSEQLEQSASRLAESMKRSEASRNKVLETHDQSCHETNDDIITESRSPFNFSSLSSGIASYMSHMANNAMLK